MSERQTSDEGARKNTPSDYRVIEEPIFWRRSRSVELTPTPPPDKPEPVRRPAKVARQLALAHHLEAAICVFRRKAASDSDGRRPLIPTQSGHRFRGKAATR